MRRTGVRVSMFWNFIIHQIFLWSLAATRRFQSLHDLSRQTTGRPVPSTTCLLVLSLVFLLGFGFLLAWSISGRPDRSSTVVDTVTGEKSLSVRSSRSRVLISLTVGDEDDLEEDVEQWLPCLESVLEVDESDPEDEFDKPRTTTGRKF